MKNLQEINLTDSIADAAAGSSDAYAFLYRQTYAYCRSIAAKYLGGSEEEIEAVLQNAYLEIFSQLTENMDTDTFLNLTAQKVRHAAVEERIRINEQEGYYTPTVRFGREKTAEDMRAQDYRRYVNRTARLSGKDAQYKVEDILSQLSGSQRLCIALWLDNLTPVQIARETGMTTDEVKSNIRYANRGIERAVAVYEEQGEDLCGMAALPYLLWLSKNYNIYAMSAQAAEAAGAKAEIPNRLLNELERRKNEKNQEKNFAKAAAAGAAAVGAAAGAAVVGAADGTAAGAGSGTAAGSGTESAAEAPAAAASGPAAAQREAFAGTSAGKSAAQKEAFAEASAGKSAAQKEAFAGTSAGVSAGASAAGAGTERAAGAGRETMAGPSAEETDTSDVVDAFAGMNLFGEAAGGEFDGSEYAMGSGAGENAGGEFSGGSESGSGGSSAGRPAYTEIAGFGYSTEASFDESANSGSVYATGSRAGSDASAGESEYAMGSGSESAGASSAGIGVIGTANAPAEETGSTGFSTDGSEYAMGGGESAGAGRSEYTESPGFGENADYSAEDSAEYAAEYAAEDAAADSGSGNARIIRILIAVVCAAVIVIIAALVIGKMNTKDKTADSTEQTQEDVSAEQTDGTDSTNGGTDSTSSDTDSANSDSENADSTNSGSDGTDDTNGGSDSTDDTNGGSDSTDDTNGGSDSADSTDSGTGTSGDSSLTQGYTPQELVEQINVACGLSYSYVGDAYYSAADENIDGIAGVTGIYLADLDQDGSDEMLLFVSGDAAYDFTLEIQVYEKDENDAWTAAASLQTDADEVKNGGYFERYRNMKFYLLGSYIVMETGSAGYDEADTSSWRLFDTEVTTCFSYSGGTLTENAGAAESLGITCRADLYTGEAQELVSVSSVHVSADSLAQKGYTMTGTASDIWAVSFVNFQALEYDGSYTDSGIAFYYPSYYNNDTESVQFASTAGESITISAKGASAASAEAALFSIVIDISLLDSYHLIDDDTIDDATGFRTTGGGCLLAYSEENAWFYYRGEFAETAAASGGNLELYAHYFLMMCDSAEIPYHCTITGASQTYPSM